LIAISTNGRTGIRQDSRRNFWAPDANRKIPESGRRSRRKRTSVTPRWLARSSFKPLPCTGSAMGTTGPTTGTSFTSLEILDRALDSATAGRSLFGRDNPTNPFVPRERRQILPSRLRRRFRAKGLAQVSRSLVQRTCGSRVLHNTVQRHSDLPLSKRIAGIANNSADRYVCCGSLWPAAVREVSTLSRSVRYRKTWQTDRQIRSRPGWRRAPLTH